MKQAVILAAGEGQRLRPFTLTKPKVMLSIADKPILGYIATALAESGIRKMVLVVGYQSNQVLDYMGSGEQFGTTITYVTQHQRLGAAHALCQAKDLVADEFLVLPGDKLIEADTVRKFITLKPHAVLVKRLDNPRRYGPVDIENGVVKHIAHPGRARVAWLTPVFMLLTGKYSVSWTPGQPSGMPLIECSPQAGASRHTKPKGSGLMWSIPGIS